MRGSFRIGTWNFAGERKQKEVAEKLNLYARNRGTLLLV